MGRPTVLEFADFESRIGFIISKSTPFPKQIKTGKLSETCHVDRDFPPSLVSYSKACNADIYRVFARDMWC